jgi:L-threonylcarbamoyladenylate synthase
MNTELYKIDEHNIDASAKEILEKAGHIIKEGGLVAFPTETVYGLGGDALNPESSRKIYAAKGRPSDNPLIVHVASMEDVEAIVKEVPQAAYKLAEAFWPGPLTMIMNKNDKVPHETTGGLDTVAIRMPNNEIALELIRQSGGYIAAPSANTSGRPSPTVARYCEEDLSGKIEMIIDGGQVGIGLESTIVDLTSDEPMILRPGYITQDMLKDILGQVTIDRTIIDASSTQKPKAPGMKYRHYAPKGSLAIVQGNQKDVVDYINARAKEAMAEGKRVGIIGTDATRDLYSADVIKSVGNREDEASIAHELFKVLREFDDENIDVMFSESFDESGIGQAIMNRLLKAAGHNVIIL